LIANAIGIDRSTMYMIRDTGNESETGKYATCGLTTKKGEWTKKPSWYGVYTLKNTLKGFEFKEAIKQNETMYIYKFSNTETNEDCYVLWSPTEDGSKIDNYSLNIGNRTQAQLTVLTDNSETGEQSTLDIQDQKVIVNVTESPIFVKVSGSTTKPAEDNTVDNNTVSNNTVNNNTVNNNTVSNNTISNNTISNNTASNNTISKNTASNNTVKNNTANNNAVNNNTISNNTLPYTGSKNMILMWLSFALAIAFVSYKRMILIK
jgi:hypothetical protein